MRSQVKQKRTVTATSLFDRARDTDGCTAVGDTRVEGANVAGFMSAGQTKVVVAAIDSDVFLEREKVQRSVSRANCACIRSGGAAHFVALGELVNHSLDGLHTGALGAS